MRFGVIWVLLQNRLRATKGRFIVADPVEDVAELRLRLRVVGVCGQDAVINCVRRVPLLFSAEQVACDKISVGAIQASEQRSLHFDCGLVVLSSAHRGRRVRKVLQKVLAGFRLWTFFRIDFCRAQGGENLGIGSGGFEQAAIVIFRSEGQVMCIYVRNDVLLQRSSWKISRTR
jgi:hypothetical protein